MFGALRDRLRRARPPAPPEAGASGDGATTGPYPVPMAPPSAVRPPAPGLRPRRGLPDPLAPEPGEMPFLDHLEELRWRIIKALGGVVVTTAVCLFFAEWVVDTLLLGPTRVGFASYGLLGIEAVELVLQNRTITGQFFAYFGTVLATGLILGSPFVVWQAWRFVEPGLLAHERASLRFVAFYATACFLLGVTFGYAVLTPLALQFFAQFTVSAQIVNEFDITRYFSMVLTWSFSAGLLFELPVVIYVLARTGVVTAATLRKARKYALVVILIVAAVLTPPDPLSQLILAIPLLGLYELAVAQAGWIERRQRREEARAARQAAAAPEKPPEG